MKINKKILILILIVLAAAVFLISNRRNESLVKPDIQVPAPEAPGAPKVVQYDSSTDLEKELESINPQILESDF